MSSKFLERNKKVITKRLTKGASPRDLQPAGGYNCMLHLRYTDAVT